jgi:hypothetical protein
MRPRIFGYIRIVGAELPGDDRDVRRELATHAERVGFVLDQVFAESVRSPEPAFSSMLDALKNGDVKDVIVPSLWHFARLPGFQAAMRKHVELETGARIWVVNSARHCDISARPDDAIHQTRQI